MNSEAHQAMIAGLFMLSRLQRGAPDLAEQSADGGSLVLGMWAQVLDDALPALTAAEVDAAVRAIPAVGPFFPAPAELIEQVRQIRRQRALSAAQGASEARRLALPAPDDSGARVEALAAIGQIMQTLTAKLGIPERYLSKRSVHDMEVEVARMRALEGKPFRVIDGGKS